MDDRLRTAGWQSERAPRARKPRAAMAAVALTLLGALAGLWACGPRQAQPLAAGPAPELVGSALAAPAPAVPAEAAAVPSALTISATHELSSTAYCLKGSTRTGIRTRNGIAAADPALLPLGSVVRVAAADGTPLGVFVIMDTGGAVRGAKIDLYMESCRRAEAWGRKRVVAEVLSLGFPDS